MPLAMFLAFNAATLAVPGAPSDPLARLVAQGGPALSAAVATFSLLAIFTSFAGTATGAHTARALALCAPRCAYMRPTHASASHSSAALPAADGITGPKCR